MADFTQETADLIERMCRNVERKDFVLNKKAAAEAILKTYDLFGLKRPDKVVWYKDIFDKSYQKALNSAGLAGSAGSARSARLAGSAGSAWSAWSALDYDFDWFVAEYEYVRNPDKKYPPNENDHNYIEYSELLMLAMEAGAGYRVEWEDVLYIVPTPLVLIDNQNRWHSEEAPAIRWKGGEEFYYLRGENFEKKLWQKIVSRKITATEVMKITDVDKRTIAISMLSPDEMLKQLNAVLVDTGKKGTKLYECKDFMDTGDTEYCMLMTDASTPREFIEFVPPEVGEKKDADLAQAVAMGLTKKEYLAMELEA